MGAQMSIPEQQAQYAPSIPGSFTEEHSAYSNAEGQQSHFQGYLPTYQQRPQITAYPHSHKYQPAAHPNIKAAALPRSFLRKKPSHLDAITALSTPRFTWTNKQCRLWLFAVLNERCGHTASYARCASRKFKYQGCAPNLWLKTREEWEKELGPDGLAIYCFLSDSYEQEMKEHQSVAHFEKTGWASWAI